MLKHAGNGGRLRRSAILDSNGSMQLSMRMAAGKKQNLRPGHLSLTHPTPLYQHLFANVGEYEMGGGEP